MASLLITISAVVLSVSLSALLLTISWICIREYKDDKKWFDDHYK